MINISNYHTLTKDLDFSSLPPALKNGHDYVNTVSRMGTSWEDYNDSEAIRKVINTYFSKLEPFLKGKTDNKTPEAKKVTPAPKAPRAVKKSREKPKTTRKTAVKKKKETPKPDFTPVESIDEAVKFIKRFTALHGKQRTDRQVLSFINSLQKAIIEKRIRKTSPHAETIRYIQDSLLKAHSTMGSSIKFEIRKEKLEKLNSIGSSEKVRPSVAFIKRYVGLHGKAVETDKVKRLYNSIAGSINTGKIATLDPYYKNLRQVLDSLKEMAKGKRTTAVLQIHSSELNGLHGILRKCGCQGLDGLEPEAITKPQNQIMNSMEFSQMKFRSLGFKGKWLDLIGDPCPGFTAMVYGKPKMGKSYLCVDFAGYLSRNFGKVLYVAREEKLDATLQKKLNDKDVKHPNLFVSDFLPGDLSGYKFVFLDSVNKLGLGPEELSSLSEANPGVSFIYVFQSTKQGNFRGGNEFQHDVDVVIEVPEKGKAVQFGRFNQGGEIAIWY